MFRPEAVPAGRRGAMLAGVLFLAVVALDSLSAVRALPLQSAPSSEDAAAYPEGDRDNPAAADEDAGRYPYGDGTYGDGTYGPEQRAQELYLDGMDKLGGGHREWAQETFETVIARFPDSAAAGLARQRLGDLYRGTPPPSATAAVSNPVPAPLSARVAVVSPPASAPGRGPVWEQELRRNAPIQAKLRGEAGDRIFFSSGSAELGTRARMALAAQAQWLIRWHEFEAAVEGHADEPGTEEENVALSRERAEAVRQRLIEEGVEASRISIVAAGRTQRVATCTAPDCTSQNRRAVTLVFASGTRARLGLAGPATADASSTPEPAPTKAGQTPPLAQQAGVTR
jgi:outer membrane protein OmpA-like peptidoglycan-associated protein